MKLEACNWFERHLKAEQGKKDFALLFIRAFLEGYLTENKLEKYWLSKIPFFLNYRQLYSYIYFVNFLSEEQKSNDNILEGMKSRIESDISYLDIEYTEMIED